MENKKNKKKTKPLRFFIRRIYPGKSIEGKDGKPPTSANQPKESG